jgi:hypothetical protein
MATFFVPTIVRGTGISVATYDFVDNLIAKTLTKQISASNVATIKCDRAHGRVPGDIVYIIGLTTHLEYNGYFQVTAVSTDGLSFSYALTHAADAENADLGGEIHDPIAIKKKGFFLRATAGDVRYSLLGQSSVRTATKSINGSNVATITTQEEHGLRVGSTVRIQGLTGAHAADYNAAFTVTVINNPKSFSFALTHAADTENVDANGIVDDTILKTIGTSVYFIDPEELRKVYTLGTTATGIVIGYAKHND